MRTYRNTSRSGGLPNRTGAASGRQKFTISVNGRRGRPIRSEEQISATVDLLELREPGFLAISKASGDYAQCGGGHGQYTVESRDWFDESYQTFRHFVAGTDEPAEAIVRVPTSEYSCVSVRANECLAAAQAKVLLISYFRTGHRHPDYCWRDMTASFLEPDPVPPIEVDDESVTYYEYGRGIAGRRGGAQALPQIYRGSGKWRDFDDPENWMENAMQISKAEFEWLIKGWDRD